MVNCPPAFHIMVKPRGAICNLNCAYCYYLKKQALYPNGTFRMDDTTLENFVRQYILTQKIPVITFGWQGGEPTLMGIDFFQKALQFQKKYAPPNVKIENTLQTNGVLLDENWCRFLHDNHFLVGLSIDGPADLHDPYRRDKNNGASHVKVIKAWNLLKKFKVDTNILCCVQAKNVTQPLKVYRYFRDELKAQYLQFIPIVEPSELKDEHKNKVVIEQSISGIQFGKFLNEIFDEWVRKDIGTIFVQFFDTTLATYLKQPGTLCVFSKTCGNALAMEFNGDLFSCDHFVDPPYKLGNINQDSMEKLVGSSQQDQFGQEKYTKLPKLCKQCPVVFACNGGCPKDRLLKTPEGEPGLNYLCAGYKSFFTHIDPYMRMMADLLRAGQPALNIMNFMRTQKFP